MHRKKRCLQAGIAAVQHCRQSEVGRHLHAQQSRWLPRRYPPPREGVPRLARSVGIVPSEHRLSEREFWGTRVLSEASSLEAQMQEDYRGAVKASLELSQV